MDASTEDLIDTLGELADLLESDGSHQWSSWMRRAKSQLQNGDVAGAQYVLRAYGGMGSINDLVLGQSYGNGQFAWKAGYRELNERFEELRTKAWELAKAVRIKVDAR